MSNYRVERRIKYKDGDWSPWMQMYGAAGRWGALMWIEENAKSLAESGRELEYRIVTADGRIFSAKGGGETQLAGLVGEPDVVVKDAAPEVTIPKSEYESAKRKMLIVDTMIEDLDRLRAERDEAAVRLAEELAKGDAETSWYWIDVWSKLVENQSAEIWLLEKYLKIGAEGE